MIKHLVLAAFLMLVSVACRAQPDADCDAIDLFALASLDLEEANRFELVSDTAKADGEYLSLPSALGPLVLSIRRELREGNIQWAFDTAEAAYDSLRNGLETGNLGGLFPPVLDGVVVGSDSLVGLKGECWALQLGSPSQSASISRLKETSGASFFVLRSYGSSEGTTNTDKWFQQFPVIVFYIVRVEDSVFGRINGKYEIGYVRLFPIDHGEIETEASQFAPRGVPYIHALLYGVG